MTPTQLNVVYVKETGHVVAAATRTADPAGLAPASEGVRKRVFDGNDEYDLVLLGHYLASRAAEYRPHGTRVLLGDGDYELDDDGGTIEPLPAGTPTVALGAGKVTVDTRVTDPRRVLVLLSTEEDPVIADVTGSQELSYGGLASGDKAAVLVLIEGLAPIAKADAVP